MDTQVQVALISAGVGLCGYIVGMIQKTVERYLGQRNFQKKAIVILKDLDKEIEDVKTAVEQLNRGMESQRSIMKQLLSYAKQHAEAAKSMSLVVEQFMKKAEADSEDEENNSYD